MRLERLVKLALIAVLITLALTLFWGLANVGNESYDQPVIVKHVPKIEKKIETRTVTKPVQAAPCLELAQIAQRMLKAADAYEAILGRETRIQDESYQATTDRNQAEMNKAAEDHRKIVRDTLDAALELQEAKKDLESAEKDCRSYPEK